MLARIRSYCMIGKETLSVHQSLIHMSRFAGSYGSSNPLSVDIGWNSQTKCSIIVVKKYMLNIC